MLMPVRPAKAGGNLAVRGAGPTRTAMPSTNFPLAKERLKGHTNKTPEKAAAHPSASRRFQEGTMHQSKSNTLIPPCKLQEKPLLCGSAAASSESSNFWPLAQIARLRDKLKQASRTATPQLAFDNSVGSQQLNFFPVIRAKVL